MQEESLRQFGQVDFLPMFMMFHENVETYGCYVTKVEAILMIEKFIRHYREISFPRSITLFYMNPKHTLWNITPHCSDFVFDVDF